MIGGSARAVFEALAHLFKPRRYVRFTTSYSNVDPQAGGHIRQFMGPAIEVPPTQLDRWAQEFIRPN